MTTAATTATSMAKSRRGFVFPMLMLSAAAAGMLALAITVAAAQRAHAARAHQVRVQGREWCLGARQLPDGAVLVQGSWTITVADHHAVTAASALGTYRMAADGRESWSITP